MRPTGNVSPLSCGKAALVTYLVIGLTALAAFGWGLFPFWRNEMFAVEYVTPSRKFGRQERATWTGAHALARVLYRKGCVSVTVTKPGGAEVYILNKRN